MRIDWGPASFARTHKWDRNFFLLMLGLIWLGVLMGFVPEIIKRHETRAPSFPMIVDFHAVAFVGWLCLLTAQVSLIRAKRMDLHRKLGVTGMYLYPVMVVLGVAAAIIVQRSYVGSPLFHPAFIIVQFFAMLNFAVLAGAAFWFRSIPSAHKRLIILATIYIAVAGFSRWWGPPIRHFLIVEHGLKGYWVITTSIFVSTFLLAALLGLYDVITRRRLHPAFIFGAVFGLGNELIASWVLLSSWWTPVATEILGL